MKIKMLKTMLGSNDGISVKKFKEGQIYICPFEISEELLKVFIENNYAEETEILEAKEEIQVLNIEENLLEDVEVLEPIEQEEKIERIEHKDFKRNEPKPEPKQEKPKRAKPLKKRKK
jgi:hypothetical protein